MQQLINLARQGFDDDTLILVQSSGMKFKDNDVTRGMQFSKLVKVYFVHACNKMFSFNMVNIIHRFIKEQVCIFPTKLYPNGLSRMLGINKFGIFFS